MDLLIHQQSEVVFVRDTHKGRYTSPYSLDGRIPLREAIPLGLQHVLALFVGNLSPLLVIMATCGITDGGGFSALHIALLQNAMLIAGLITFIQLYPSGRSEAGCPSSWARPPALSGSTTRLRPA